MEKEIFAIEDLKKLDDLTIMHYFIPVIVVSVVGEWLYGIYKKRDTYHKKEFFSALTIGAVNTLLSAALKIWIFSIALLIYNAVPWAIPRGWYTFVICFIAMDFCRYWAHRVAHEQRFWWATHVTHHSSENMNFSVAFRTGWTQHIKFIFFLPVPFLGIDPFTLFICNQIIVLYQFFVHTELVRRLPRSIEYIFVTPSHHRVHHGSNPGYIDKNYGSTFIIWDRLYGTFEPEREQVKYGITKPVKSFNPVYLVFHEWVDIWNDLKHTKSAKEVFQILFKPPGAIVTEHQRLSLQQEENAQLVEKDEQVLVTVNTAKAV
ncbi:sterol desaturase family protein [Pontibacter rugosus]|uniref:Sterol desaturase family protein n=1 Tax=Pontibacter rugosus TaxID=1745966 RepID=A0ABW3SVD0_9BACT